MNAILNSEKRFLSDAYAGAVASALPPIACFDCGLVHKLPADTRQAIVSARDFAERHHHHAVSFIDPARPVHGGLEGFRGNADLKMALQTVQSMTVTNLHSLASSATAGWQSAEVDNSASLYLAYRIQGVLDFANTAPANNKAAYLFLASGIETGKLANPFSGTEGALTLPDVTTNMLNPILLGTMAYNVADEVVESREYIVAPAPTFWAVGIINYTGAALAASGNTVKYRGEYATVI